MSKKLITGGLTVLIVALMVGASELSGEREIIFPEITALAVGALVSPRRSWRADRPRMLLLITACAVFGLIISVYAPFPLWVKVSLAFLIGQLVYLFSGTSFAPLISAIVLPVLLGTGSVIYPVAAFLLTLIIILVDLALEKTGIKKREEYSPLPPPSKDDLIAAAVRAIVVTPLIALALAADARFIVAPPLLVAFTEFSLKNSKARIAPGNAVLLITACAFAGSLCRYGLTIALGLPLTFAAVAAAVVSLLLMHANGRFLPPAGAMTVLAMLIPEESVALYPFHVLFGASLLTLLAMLLFGREKYGKSDENIKLRSNEWRPIELT